MKGNKFLKKIFFIFFAFVISKNIFAQRKINFKSEYKKLVLFQNSYPDLKWHTVFDKEKSDWKITVGLPDGKEEKIFYWSLGSMLPEKELDNKEKYWPLLYNYEVELKDPANFSEEEKSRLKEFSSSDNRKNGAGTPMFFFDFIYDSYTKASLESHLLTITFLGKKATVHERIKKPLAQVEKRIYELALTDNEVQTFLNNIKSNDAYFWRIISGTNRKSFHSLGIALDILPVNQAGKEIYWAWAKEKNPEGWMLTPLSKRWTPPLKVINIFEQEGFIWGGKWSIWDNMHFEYHPELIDYNFKYKSQQK